MSAAQRTLGFASRVTKFCGADALAYLYTALVLPQLKYCCSVWLPHQAYLIGKIEGVQRQTTKTMFARFPPLHSVILPYENRFTPLKWCTIQHRRRVVRLSVLSGPLTSRFTEW